MLFNVCWLGGNKEPKRSCTLRREHYPRLILLMWRDYGQKQLWDSSFGTHASFRRARSHHARCLVPSHWIPWPGIEPGPRRWERRILTTRPPGTGNSVQLDGLCWWKRENTQVYLEELSLQLRKLNQPPLREGRSENYTLSASERVAESVRKPHKRT